MKKLIFTSILCLFATTLVSAKNMENSKINPVEVNKTTFDISALFKLIKAGNYKVVKMLIESGEDVNKKSNGLTPLMFAARYNKAKIAQLLIDNGAKLKTKSKKGKLTALEMADRSKAKDAYKVIKKALSN